jgi:hypothetical protein
MTRPQTRWKRRVVLAIGPVLMVAIVASLDWGELRGIFAGARPGPLLAAYLVPLPAIALRNLRWRRLLGRHAAGWRFSELLVAYTRSIALGVLTPGRVGELAKAAFVARRSGWGPALWSTLLDRLADVGFLALLALGAALLYAAPGAGETALLACVATAVLAGSAALWWLGRGAAAARWRRRLLRLAGRGAPPEDEPPPEPLPAGAALACALLTVVSWAVTYEANHLYCVALGLEIGYLQIAGISAVASLVASLPISVAGAGTRDATLIALLAPYGASAAQAVALSALMLSNVLFVAAVCASTFLAWPRSLSSATRS